MTSSAGSPLVPVKSPLSINAPSSIPQHAPASGSATGAAREAPGTKTHGTTHARSESTDTPGLVRLVGRGGQGSRPRNLRIDTESSVPRVFNPSSAEAGLSALQCADSARTRIVGRGGIGSRPRPRELFIPATLPERCQTAGLTSPVSSIATQPTSPNGPPALYRPAGRGGAGSRPRKPMSASEESTFNARSPLKLWKGKGKAKEAPPGSPSTYGAATLTRTDTVGTNVSSIYFTPARTLGAPRPQYPALAGVSDNPAGSAPPSRQFQPAGLRKLARTLGAEFGAGVFSVSKTGFGRGSRRSSISGISLSADSSDNSCTAETVRRRCSSVDGVAPRVSESPRLETEPDGAIYAQSTPQSSLPGAPPSLQPDERHTVDTVSEISTCDDASAYDNRSLWDRTPTPSITYATAGAHSASEFPPEKPLPLSTERRFSVTLPVAVAPDCASTRSTVSSEAEWIGEWNREDIFEVINTLRRLRL